MEISGRTFAVWYYMELGGLSWTNVLNSALPTQRLRLDTWLEHQDPVRHTAAVWRKVKDSTSVPQSSLLSTLYWLFLKSSSPFELLSYLQLHHTWQKPLYLWCRSLGVVTSGSPGLGLGHARRWMDVHGELGHTSYSAWSPSLSSPPVGGVGRQGVWRLARPLVS